MLGCVSLRAGRSTKKTELWASGRRPRVGGEQLPAHRLSEGLVQDEVQVEDGAGAKPAALAVAAQELAVEVLDREWVELGQLEVPEPWERVAAEQHLVALVGDGPNPPAGVGEPLLQVSGDIQVLGRQQPALERLRRRGGRCHTGHV
jgi:hypothetical protein